MPDLFQSRISLRYFFKQLLLCLSLAVMPAALNAQEQPATLKALQKGDPFPLRELKNLLSPGGTSSLRISTEPGKLVVLAFFGSWCSTCRLELPEQQQLQDQLGTQLQLILVSAESRQALHSFFTKARTKEGKPYTLPCIAEDKELRQLFPHRLVPHLVWLKNGKLIATTGGEELTAANIKAALEGSVPKHQKKDLDPGKGLFFNEDLPPAATYSLFIKGKIDGLGSGGSTRKEGDIVYGRLLSNSLLRDMYRQVGYNLIPGFHSKRILSELKDSSVFFPPANPAASYYRENYCTYEIRLPLKDADSLYRYMLKDLNRYTPFEGSVERRKVKCWVLSAIPGKENLLKTKGGPQENTLFYKPEPKLVNMSPGIFVKMLNQLQYLTLPVLDETGITGNIDVSFPSTPMDRDQLQSVLNAHGLVLTQAERELEMLCIRNDH